MTAVAWHQPARDRWRTEVDGWELRVESVRTRLLSRDDDFHFVVRQGRRNLGKVAAFWSLQVSGFPPVLLEGVEKNPIAAMAAAEQAARTSRLHVTGGGA